MTKKEMIRKQLILDEFGKLGNSNGKDKKFQLIFTELGLFTEVEIRKIKLLMDGKTYYNFEVAEPWNNVNNYLIVYAHQVDDGRKFDSEQEMKNSFIRGCISFLLEK